MDFNAARDAIYTRVIDLAQNAEVDDLVKLADAAAKVGYGPQGARTIYDYNSTIQRTETIHYPQREREAGFR